MSGHDLNEQMARNAKERRDIAIDEKLRLILIGLGVNNVDARRALDDIIAAVREGGTLYWPTDPMHPCPTCGHALVAEAVDGAKDYDGLSAGEVWARVCDRTGIQHTTTKLGTEFDWCDFAALAEATIGLALHERVQSARGVARLADALRAAESELTSARRLADALGHDHTASKFDDALRNLRSALDSVEATQ